MGARSESYRLPAVLAEIDGVRRWSGRLMRDAGVAEETIFDLELAVTEALANSIRHGLGEGRGKLIELSLEIDSRRIALAISDHAPSFDPALVPAPDLDDPGEGGYGLHLIAQLTDELSRREEPDGSTTVTLIKYRNSPDGDDTTTTVTERGRIDDDC